MDDLCTCLLPSKLTVGLIPLRAGQRLTAEKSGAAAAAGLVATAGQGGPEPDSDEESD